MTGLVGVGASETSETAKDVTIETFEAEVLAASATQPVIVDFWAEWCAPCKQLAPALEAAVAATKGAVKLVKIDIDKNQMLAQQMRIQSVPTVYAFFQGRPVDGFQGALPESEIKAFIERLSALAGEAGAGAAAGVEDYLNAGVAAFEGGDLAAAAQLFGQALQADPENVTAAAGLARCYLASGDPEKAKQTIELLPDEKKKAPELESIVASIKLAETAGDAGDLAGLKAAAERAPEDCEARYNLAEGLIAAGDLEGAIDALLAIIERDREWNDDAARSRLLTVFEALGHAAPATVRGRRRLSSILFS